METRADTVIQSSESSPRGRSSPSLRLSGLAMCIDYSRGRCIFNIYASHCSTFRSDRTRLLSTPAPASTIWICSARPSGFGDWITRIGHGSAYTRPPQTVSRAVRAQRSACPFGRRGKPSRDRSGMKTNGPVADLARFVIALFVRRRMRIYRVRLFSRYASTSGE